MPSPQKILVIRMSSMGDIVLTSPVVRVLKTQLHPTPEVHFLVREAFADVVLENPHIDKVHTCIKEVDDVLSALQQEGFDYVVDLHKNRRSKKVVRKLGVTSSNFPKENVYKWLLVNFKVNRMPEQHVVDRYFEALKPLQLENDGLGLEFYFDDEAAAAYAQLPEPIQKDYVAVVVGAAHATKALPLNMLMDICREIDRPVVLIGGKKEMEVANAIVAALGNDVHNLCGSLTIQQSAYLIKKAGKVLTPDTGMMHIAAALGTPLVSVWGNTVPDFGMYPYMPQTPDNYSIMEVEDLKCRPCSKIGFDKCPKGHFDCMQQQDVAAIIRLLNN